MKKEVLRYEKISRFYQKKKIINKLSLNVYANESLKIVCQHNPFDKEILLSVIGCVYPPDSGKIYLNGKAASLSDITKLEQICIIDDTCRLYLNMTIAENIFILRNQEKHTLFIHSKKIKMETQALLNTFRLQLNADDTVRNLSKFEKLLIELVRAYTMNPALIVIGASILNSLNASSCKILYDLINKFKIYGTSFIFITTSLQENISFCERNFIFQNGKLFQLKNSTDYFHAFPYCFLRSEKKLYQFTEYENPISAPAILDMTVSNTHITAKAGHIIGIHDINMLFFTTLFKALTSNTFDPPVSIKFMGQTFIPKSISKSTKYGIVFINQLPLKDYHFSNMSQEDNLLIMSYSQISHSLFISNRMKNYLIQKNLSQIKEYSDDYYTSSSNISLQIYLTRIENMNPKLIILMDPYEKFDEISQNIWNKFILRMLKRKKAIIVTSSDYQKLSFLTSNIISPYDKTNHQELART